MLPILASAGAGCGWGRHPLEGQRAPDLRLADLQGAPHRLGEYLGRDTILTFWLDCPVCRAELPLLDSASRTARGRLQVVGVNSHDAPTDVVALSRQLGIGFPLLLDPAREAERAYQVVTAPTAFHIDPSGLIVEVQVGTAGYDLAWRQQARPGRDEVQPSGCLSR